MRWSMKIARIAGIDIFVHFTFFILLMVITIMHYFAEKSISAAIEGALFIVAVFTIVVFHELSHALTARRFGISTKDINLLPIGGVARLERIPENPKHEFWVAIAGPSFNLALAGVIYVILSSLGISTSIEAVQFTGAPFMVKLFWVNITIAIFNLLPAFPMDGGRVLRAILAMNMNYVQATDLAARIGQGMAVLFGLLGFFTNPLLIFIAVFVWLGAEQEAAMARMKGALYGIPVRHIMIAKPITLSPQDSLQEAVRAILEGYQDEFPVVHDGQVVGLLSRQDLISGITEKGVDSKVSNSMRTEFIEVHPNDLLPAAFQKIQSSGLKTVPVTDQGELVGVLTLENLAEYLMIQKALNTRSENTLRL